MNTKKIVKNAKRVRVSILTVLFFMLLSSASTSFAEGDAIKTMAKIMLNLNHHASDSEKTTLRNIAKVGDDEHDKALAEAIINLNHKVNSGDISKLKFVIKDDDSSKEERDLAKIILNLEHKPSSSDKSILKNIM